MTHVIHNTLVGSLEEMLYHYRFSQQPVATVENFGVEIIGYFNHGPKGAHFLVKQIDLSVEAPRLEYCLYQHSPAFEEMFHIRKIQTWLSHGAKFPPHTQAATLVIRWIQNNLLENNGDML
jgi:hypothetical protein